MVEPGQELDVPGLQSSSSPAISRAGQVFAVVIGFSARGAGYSAGRRWVIAQPARLLGVVVRIERGCSGVNP